MYINWIRSKWPGSNVLTIQFNSFVNSAGFWRKLWKVLGRFINSVLVEGTYTISDSPLPEAGFSGFLF